MCLIVADIMVDFFLFLQNQNKALIEELKSLKELYAGKSYGASEVKNVALR